MFNRSVYYAGDNTQNLKINAVSGGIVKNHKDSYFLRFNLKSDMSEALLSPKPCRLGKRDNFGDYAKIPVEVLQMVMVGDMEVVAEVIELPDEKDKEAA